jgi:hypothetical protein
MPDKPGTFLVRFPRDERMGFRVLRCHRAANMKQIAWLQTAIREAVERMEREIGMPPGETPFKPNN